MFLYEHAYNINNPISAGKRLLSSVHSGTQNSLPSTYHTRQLTIRLRTWKVLISVVIELTCYSDSPIVMYHSLLNMGALTLMSIFVVLDIYSVYWTLTLCTGQLPCVKIEVGVVSIVI